MVSLLCVDVVMVREHSALRDALQGIGNAAIL